jgi:hypothetical protein
MATLILFIAVVIFALCWRRALRRKDFSSPKPHEEITTVIQTALPFFVILCVA